MQVNKESVRLLNIAILFFFAFFGYYAVLIVLTNSGLSSLSRQFTIPLRVLIVCNIFVIFLFRPKIKPSLPFLLFFLFSLFYYLRIALEYADPFSSYHKTEVEFFLYFTSFVVLPFILLSNIRFNSKDYNLIFKSLIFSSGVMSILTLIFYGNFIGETSRLSMVISRDENYISPLVLSYCSSLSIGIGLIYFLSNKTTKYLKILLISVVLLSIPPFLLGASRGSVIALILPLLVYFMTGKGLTQKLKVLLGGVTAIMILYALAEITGSGVFSRLLGIETDFERGQGAATRLDMWIKGYYTFIENPIFGNSLESDYYRHYPHNIIVEIAISTGILGLIPFLSFTIINFRYCYRIIATSPEYAWITVIFMQAFIQNMFSGSIYTASWLAIGSGLLCGYILIKKS